MSFDFFESTFPFVFTAIFIVIIGIFIVVVVRGISQWTKNNNSPRIPTQARAVTKRMYTGGGVGDADASSSYYITFEFLSGDRKEYHVPYQEYALIAENDVGILTFQGTRFISFVRNKEEG